jgi:hypothetical protein
LRRGGRWAARGGSVPACAVVTERDVSRAREAFVGGLAKNGRDDAGDGRPRGGSVPGARSAGGAPLLRPVDGDVANGGLISDDRRLFATALARCSGRWILGRIRCRRLFGCALCRGVECSGATHLLRARTVERGRSRARRWRRNGCRREPARCSAGRLARRRGDEWHGGFVVKVRQSVGQGRRQDGAGEWVWGQHPRGSWRARLRDSRFARPCGLRARPRGAWPVRSRGSWRSRPYAPERSEIERRSR